MTTSLAISPCPNDTFVFHALVRGLVPGAPRLEVTYADVDVTNTAVAHGEFDLAKISVAALPGVGGDYELLPCGGAVGRGCGPLLLTRSERTGVDLSTASVAIPGELTTAYLLFRLWAGDRLPARLEVLPFQAIMPAVAAGRYDAGLVIHEARFTYPRHGLRPVVDLGQWWESDTGLPIPLGAIVARRGAVDPDQAAHWVRESVRAAWANPAASRAFVLAHAQEMEPEVVDRHIATYVNEFTLDLGAEGRAAVDALLSRASSWEESMPDAGVSS
jgi:1,4-dihydroxy-6-naphthoate synthase